MEAPVDGYDINKRRLTFELTHGGIMANDLMIKYETIAASATNQKLGAAGKTNDRIDRLIIIPDTLTAGAVALLDGTVSTTVFVAGTLTSLVPIVLELGARSTTGGWGITTGTAVHCIAVGEFS